MKKSAAIAIAILTLGAGAAAQAQTFNQGDILLGLTASSGTGLGTELIFDLGNYANFSSINLDQSAAGSVISSTYGSNWYNSGLVNWMVFSAQQTGDATTRSVWASVDPSQLNSGKTLSANVNGLYNNMNALYANWGATLVTTNSVAGYNYLSYASANTGGTVWSAQDAALWGTSVSAPLEVSVVNGGSLNINFYERNGTTNNLGAIQVSGGVISAVPEPATYALFGLGALLLVIASRRRNA